MHTPLELDAYAQELMRDRQRQAAQDALAAQLPPRAFPLPRPDLAARARVANALLALAVRLDPCSALAQPSRLSLTSR